MADETIRTILVPTDFSDGAMRALGWARALARAFRANITLLHVTDVAAAWMPVGGLGAVPAPVPADFIDRLNEAAQAALAGTAAGATEVTRRLLRDGHARDVILDVAREEGADVIVMGTHGRRGFSHVFLGSVAEHIVRQAPIPVWTVRTPDR